MPKPNALHSLYGGKTALSGNIGGQKREQTVFTPEWFIDQISLAAGSGPSLDPCTTSENPVGADLYYTEAVNGLLLPWKTPRWVYWNPPYNRLEQWMLKAFAEAQNGVPSYGLIPLRPQRGWYARYARGAELVPLAPFPFQGHKSSFPAPLVLLAWHLPPPERILNPKNKNLVLGFMEIHATPRAKRAA